MSIKEQVEKVKQSLADYPNVNIIAATKYLSVEQTMELVDAGVTELGENRVDLFLEKYEALKDRDIKWHFFGCLQTRKVREIADKIDCLHSLDNTTLAVELNKRLTHPLDCFIQVNISEEASKQGVPASKVKSFVKSLEKYPNIHVVGLMCIGTMTYDNEILEKEFSKMHELQQEIEEMYYDHAPCERLSMGMSNDYLIAVTHGATDVRLGRIFLK